MLRFRKSNAVAWVCAGLVLATGWFYFWTAVPEWPPGLIARESNGYYDLLTRGFLKGKLSLDLEADPFLATLKDPTDPVKRGAHGLHDASYYHGRYYLYFGVSPVVLLFLPFRLVTGLFIDEGLASPVFATVGLAAAAWLLLAVRRRYFPAAPSWIVLGCVVALGLGDLMAQLLRRPSVWEVPITCGYACCMVALCAIFQSLHGRHPARWLALAGAAFGFAVGSRPTYLLACAALLPPIWSLARERAGEARQTGGLGWRRLALAALLPLAAIGLGLAAYNDLRFGNPLDFGLRHVMAGEDTGHETLFAWRFLWYNFRVYAFAPAEWSRYFPFVTLAKLPPPPIGHLGVEDPYGVLPNIPFVFFALGSLVIFCRRESESLGRLPAFCASLLVTAVGTGLMVAAFGGADNRYMVDFLPAWMLLACVGLLALASRPWHRGAARTFAAVGVGLLLGYSAIFNILVSLRHNELLRDNHPAIYRRLAHRWNGLSFALDRWEKIRYGPVEMKVIFPAEWKGGVEPLVVTGRVFLSDYLFVNYLGPDSVRFGLEHTSGGTFVGEPMRITPGQPHLLRIDMGSLYPPAAHPYFDAMSANEARLRQQTVRVTVDGQIALDRELTFYDAAGPMPTIGSSGARLGFPRPFSGQILAWRRLPEAKLERVPGHYGPLRLALVFPPFTTPRTEPLVSTGTSGHGDLIYVRYDTRDHVSFGDDHWGTGGTTSPSFAIKPGATQVVEIDFGALHPVGSEDADGVAPRPGRLVVRLNGRSALDESAPYYPCDPGTVAVWLNAIQASSASSVFTGTRVKSERLPVESLVSP